MLKIKNLTKAYNSKNILDNISINIENKEIALFLGSSGVGKSTLLRILNDLETFDSGSILLDDVALEKNHSVGMVFQQFNLFENMSVLRNITFVLETSAKIDPLESKKIALELLEKYGLADKAQLMTQKLSGGQKQRLAIARSLALKPKVICFDEPTSALDPLLTSFVAKNIQELANTGYIVPIATHDTALIDKLNCTIHLMQEGKIIESAKSEDFKSDKNKFPLIKQFIEGEIDQAFSLA